MVLPGRLGGRVDRCRDKIQNPIQKNRVFLLTINLPVSCLRREETDMKKKNPWLAAVFNLFFPGVGFAYLGSVPLVIAGYGLLISNLFIRVIYYKYTVGMASRSSYWVWSVISALSLAVITFVLTNLRNNSIDTGELK
jgi:hypothetical protein